MHTENSVRFVDIENSVRFVDIENSKKQSKLSTYFFFLTVMLN